MSNDNALHLVSEEILLFDKLPAALKKTWQTNLMKEAIDAYESEAEITRRFKDSRFEAPGLKEMIQGLGEKNGPQLNLETVTEPAWAEYFYTIGASGASALIQIALQSPGLDDGQMEVIAAMSRIRHVILQENASKK